MEMRQSLAGSDQGTTDAVNDLVVPIEVWVDRDGLVRRVSFEYRLDGFAEGQEPGAYRPDVSITLDLFDYGDESINVELPTDAVDITDAFREVLDLTAVRST
jgi:hypothetical protein